MTSPTDSRQRLIQAATEAFMAEGYRASLDRIAERAGVSRQTIYNNFKCKDDLFSEVAHVAATTILVPLHGNEGDLRQRLVQFGLALRDRTLGSEGLAMHRTLSAEAPRFPNLIKAFFDKGPRQTVRRLSEFIETAMEEGHLRKDDPVFVSEMLVSMLEGYERTRRLFGAPQPTDEREHERVARIIDCFLRAFAPGESIR